VGTQKIKTTNHVNILIGKLKEGDILEDNIKMDLKEIKYEDVG
jgi:hypothetical protein